MNPLTRSISLAAATAAAALPLSAQTFGLERRSPSGLAIEVFRPGFIEGFEAGGLTLFAGGHTQLRPDAVLLIEVPFAYVTTTNDEDAKKTALGNPYVGLQLRRGPVTVELGGRAPLADDELDASFIGFSSDIQRFDAFMPDYAPVTALGRVDHKTVSGATIAAFMGLTSFLYTGDEDDEDNEMIMNYGAELGYSAPEMRVSARAHGSVALTESGPVRQRTSHNIGFSGELGRGRVRPTFALRIPLGDQYDWITWNGGLGVTIALGGQ